MPRPKKEPLIHDGFGNYVSIPGDGRKTVFTEHEPLNPGVFDILGRHNFDEFGNVRPFEKADLRMPTN